MLLRWSYPIVSYRVYLWGFIYWETLYLTKDGFSRNRKDAKKFCSLGQVARHLGDCKLPEVSTPLFTVTECVETEYY